MSLHPSLAAARNSHQLMTAVKDLALGQVEGAEGVLVMVSAPEGLVARGARGIEAEEVLKEGCTTQLLIDRAAQGEFQQLPNDEAEEEFAAMAVPLQDSDGRVRGALYVENRGRTRPFSKAAREALVDLAQQTAELMKSQEKAPRVKKKREYAGFSFIPLVLMALLTIAGGVYVNIPEPPPPVDHNADVGKLAKTLLVSLQRSDFPVAYACLASSLRQQSKPETLAGAVENWSKGRAGDLEGRSVGPVVVEETARAEIVHPDGKPWRWDFQQENGRWRLVAAEGGPPLLLQPKK